MPSRHPHRVLSLLPLLILVACAPPIRDPWGLSISRGAFVEAPRVPETFQADLGIVPHAPGAFPFSARLYGEIYSGGSGADTGPGFTRPTRRYRLDVFGFPTSIVASWLWEDEQWLLVRHDRRESLSGSGSSLVIEGSPVRLPHVRAVLGFLSGEPLPGFPGAAPLVEGVAPNATAGRGTVRWSYAGEEWEALFDPATGVCREARSPSLTLRYARHRLREGYVIPEEVGIFAGGDSLLSLSVRDWKASPAWKKNPFELKVPAGYTVK